jgi:hypothetical protein
MVSKSWSNRRLLKTIDVHAPLVQDLADLYPSSNHSCVAPCKQLTELLCELENLRKLNLAELLSTNCQFRQWTDMSFLAKLSRLEFICLSGFKGDTVPLMNDALEHLPYLSTLDMTSIWTYVHISPKLNALKTLWLGDSSIDKNTMVGISGLPSIENLDLSLTDLSVQSLEALGKSTSLRNLSLVCSKLQVAGISHLTSLTRLDLTSAKFRGTYPLKKLVNLKTLVLPLKSISSDEIADLKLSIPGITIEFAV